jgi:ABC-2 type transport system ATP-binding protein
MEEADQLCERLAIMDHGRILALDTPANLKRAVDADTIVTVHAEGDLAGLAACLGAMPGATNASIDEGAVHLYVRGVQGVLPKVVAAAEGGGFTITDLGLAEPTLETVFLTLTGKDLRE